MSEQGPYRTLGEITVSTLYETAIAVREEHLTALLQATPAIAGEIERKAQEKAENGLLTGAAFPKEVAHECLCTSKHYFEQEVIPALTKTLESLVPPEICLTKISVACTGNLCICFAIKET